LGFALFSPASGSWDCGNHYVEGYSGVGFSGGRLGLMREDLLWLMTVEETGTDGHVAGWEVQLFCGGRSRFVSKKEAAPLCET